VADIAVPSGFVLSNMKVGSQSSFVITLPEAPVGVPDSIDALAAIPGGEFKLIARNLGIELLGFPVFPDFTPLVRAEIMRTTVATWEAGSVIHELVDPDGNRYILQGIRLDTVDELGFPALDSLSGLPLPAGWSYESSVLASELVVASGGAATVFAHGDGALWELYSAVPEPGTFALGGAGLLLLARRRRGA
jgi:hypothetical protein